MRRRFLRHQASTWPLFKGISYLALYWEMRLGKTLVTIRWIKTRLDCNKILVVCPLSVVESWTRELALEGEQVTSLIGTTAKKEKLFQQEYRDDNSRQWFITNYETMTLRGQKTKEGKPKATPSWICRLGWDAIIADESTAIRKPTAQITKIFTRLFKMVPYRAVLSGLPNPEGIDDYVTQLIFVHGSFMGCKDYYSWRRKYMLQLPFGGWNVKRMHTKVIQKAVSRASLSLTREAAGIGSRKMYSVRYVDVPAKTIKHISHLNKNFEIGNKLTKLVLENMNIECQIAGGFYEGHEHQAKLKELAYLLQNDLRGQPIVIWCRYTSEVIGVAEYINNMKLKLRAAAIYGKSASSAQKSVAQNRANIDLFMQGRLDIIVCQPKCVQMGIDMSIADVSIYYSRWLDYEVNAQSSDRIVHPKKTKPILELDIVVRGTLDGDIPEIITDKKTNTNNFNEKLLERVRARLGVVA